MVSKPKDLINNSNTGFLYIANQNNSVTMQNTIANTAFLQSQQSSNQNSITNKLCKFFKNLLELEKDQGRYDESVAIIQRYINKEINVDELGTLLKGNASRAPLPESLMTSLKSNIDDLRREMFFGRVKIDRINPPPENVIDMNFSSANKLVPNNLVSAVNARLSSAQQNCQRPNLYVQQTNTVTKPMQQQTTPQIIRQPALLNTVQTRPIANPITPQATLKVSNANLRPIAPSSPVRQTIPNVSSSNIRTVSVSTSALMNAKSSTIPKSDESKNDPEYQRPNESLSNSVTLSTNILNHTNYRNRISEVFKSDSGNVNISEDALNYISEAIENFSISLLEQAAAFACHRQETFNNDPMYKKIDDVRSQLKYLQDYDDYQRASEEERQKAELFKAAKSRSKIDNQEQQKLKETVRKIQEYDKNCDEYSRANMTALKAIGSKRKIFETEVTSNLQSGAKGIRSFIARPSGFSTELQKNTPGSQTYISQGYLPGKTPRSVMTTIRHRNKRIILKDFQLVLDQDLKLRRFKTYKKIFMFGRY